MKKLSIICISIILLNSCVSSKLYEEMAYKYQSLEKENKLLLEENNDLLDYITEAKVKKQKLQNTINQRKKEIDKLEKYLNISKKLASRLKKSYDELLNNNKNLQNQNSKESQSLFAEIEKIQENLLEREKLLNEEKEKIRNLKYDLTNKQSKIDELNRIIKEKEQSLTKLKDAINNAILGFKNKGLTVTEKNGKIYVSMENKLLFKSGSWKVDLAGQKVIKQLSKVLEPYKNINILIEGHTDNVPYSKKGTIQDNWDLSVMRATSVVKIFIQNKNIDINKVTAAGRGKFDPLVKNDTKWARSKNRRIEIVLTPNLNEIEKILSNF